MNSARREIQAQLLLLAAVALLAAPVLAGGVPYYGDLTLQFIPWRNFAAQQVLAGRLPLWLPDVYLGLPFLANNQSAVLYPPHLLPLPGVVAVAAGLVLHLHLAAAGSYCFARALGRSRAAGLVAGLGYGLGGYLVSKQQFPSLGYTIAWLPWLFWAAERLRQRPGPRTAALLGVLVGLQWLSGHAQMSVLQLALLAAWWVSTPRPLRSATAWRWGLVGLLAGCGVGLAQLLPTAELLRLSPRSGFTFDDVARFNLPPFQVLTVLAPNLFGCPAGRLPYLGVGPYWEMTWYAGALTVPLALCASRAQERRVGFWWGAAAVGLALALGRYTPLYRLAYELLPPLRIFRDPARFTLYSTFALTVLAAAGYDRLDDRLRRVATGLLAGVATALVLTVLAPGDLLTAALAALLAWSPLKQVANLAPLAAGWREALTLQLLALLALLTAARAAAAAPRRRWLVALLALDLTVYGHGLNPVAPLTAVTQPPPENIPRGALVLAPSAEESAEQCFNFAHYPPSDCLPGTRRTLTPHVALGSGLRTVWGYDPLRPAATLAALQAATAGDWAQRAATLGGLGVRGEWDGQRWQPYPAPPGLVRARGGPALPRGGTPQRLAVLLPSGAARLELTLPLVPGWRFTQPPVPSPSALVTAFERCPAGLLRGWYAPASLRLGLFAALLSLGWLAALVTTCSSLRGRGT
ncbi:MAG: hypothetical protein IT204_21220 [Fimbriimonadaceae bacterium]|nr:hypothetical protein [Fimbriimonadaceae bacterium]